MKDGSSGLWAPVFSYLSNLLGSFSLRVLLFVAKIIRNAVTV